MIAKDYGKSGFVCDYAGQENKPNFRLAPGAPSGVTKINPNLNPAKNGTFIDADQTYIIEK